MSKTKKLLETGEQLTRKHPKYDLYTSEMIELFERGFQDVNERDSDRYRETKEKMSDVCFRVMSYAYTLGITRGYHLGTKERKGK